jgi:hypothetical protein
VQQLRASLSDGTNMPNPIDLPTIGQIRLSCERPCIRGPATGECTWSANCAAHASRPQDYGKRGCSGPGESRVPDPGVEQIDIGPSAPIRDVHLRVQVRHTPAAVIQVFRVADGDRARLDCIDTPEMDQEPWARIAADRLRGLLGPTVILETLELDRYGRTIGRLRVQLGVGSATSAGPAYSVAGQPHAHEWNPLSCAPLTMTRGSRDSESQCDSRPRFRLRGFPQDERS